MVAAGSALVTWIYPFGVPGTDGRVLSRRCHVIWTSPSDLSLPFPGYGLPPLSFSVRLLRLPPGNQRSLGLHDTSASPSLQVSKPRSSSSSSGAGCPTSPPCHRCLGSRCCPGLSSLPP